MPAPAGCLGWFAFPKMLQTEGVPSSVFGWPRGLCAPSGTARDHPLSTPGIFEISTLNALEQGLSFWVWGHVAQLNVTPAFVVSMNIPTTQGELRNIMNIINIPEHHAGATQPLLLLPFLLF